MLRSKTRTGIASLIAVVALGVSASAASAAPATFSPVGGTNSTVNGPYTISWGTTPTPGKTITCTAGSQSLFGTASNSGSPLQGSLTALAIIQQPQFCKDGFNNPKGIGSFTAGTLTANNVAGAYTINTSNRFYISTNGTGSNFTSAATPVATVGDWVNGALAGTLTYTNDLVAYTTLGEPVYFTGSFKLRVGTAALTLN